MEFGGPRRLNCVSRYETILGSEIAWGRKRSGVLAWGHPGGVATDTCGCPATASAWTDLLEGDRSKLTRCRLLIRVRRDFVELLLKMANHLGALVPDGLDRH